MNGNLMIREKDFNRLKDYLSAQQGLDDLENELDRAKIIKDDKIPNDLVTMNSKVRYKNLESNKESEITIVYPKDANATEGRISVFASLGSALLGLREGDEISWTFPDGAEKSLQVLKVISQEVEA